MQKNTVSRNEKKQAALEKGRALHLAISKVVDHLIEGKVTAAAEMFGYSQSALSNLINGSKHERRWPLYLLQAIADDAGLPLSVLIREAEMVMKGNAPVLTPRRKREELSAKLEALRAEARVIEKELEKCHARF